MRFRVAAAALLSLAASLPVVAQQTPAQAARADRVIAPAVFGPPPRPLDPARASSANPCAFGEIDVRRHGLQPFRNPPEIRATGGRLDTALDVRYTDPRTTSIAGCPVTLRTYDGRLVGPTLRVRPGDMLAPRLRNRLPAETAAEIHGQFLQEDTVAFITQRPVSFNTTNLHTHGLHVSPRGNSDNVLLAIAPGTTQPYDIRLPPSHTRGTYWYHAHAHGSTAIQVGSGMAGALIVDDDPPRLPQALRAASAPEREKIWVIGTILYDTRGRVDHIAGFFPDSSSDDPRSLSPDDSTCVVKQDDRLCAWNGSRRRVTVNGQIVPVIRMRRGEVQRWRLIDAAFRASVFFQVQGHSLHEIALDGIYTGRMDTWDSLTAVQLQPGYRSDVLIQARRRTGSTALEDTFQVVDAPSPAALSVRGVREPQNLIALLVVGDTLDMQLPDSSDIAKLDPFHGARLADSANQVQEVRFKIGRGIRTGPKVNSFQVNFNPFDEDRVRYVQLGNTDVWSIMTVGDPDVMPNAIRALPHVFHIHVNPFQVRRTGPDGKPQTVWKDTQLIVPGDTVNVYTRYSDFTGAFVMHCHILDHEDLGMMEVVEVVDRLPLPGSGHGHGGAAARGGSSSPERRASPARRGTRTRTGGGSQGGH